MAVLPAITVATPDDFNLPRAYQIRIRAQPFVIGTDFEVRLHFEDADGLGITLTGALITMEMRRGSVLVLRSSANTIAGSSPALKEIVPDVNQVTEVGDTGKGWYALQFTSYAADVAILSTLLDSNLRVIPIDVRIFVTDAAGKKHPHILGEWEFQ